MPVNIEKNKVEGNGEIFQEHPQLTPFRAQKKNQPEGWS
jgi:hypothetical protein